MTMRFSALKRPPPLPRVLAPELLDTLPASDPDAMRSRRDLRRINAMMMNSALIARELGKACAERPPRVIAEIGSGDGHLMLQVAHRLPQWSTLDMLLLDRQALVSADTV